MVRQTPRRPTAKTSATVEATVVSQKLNGNLDVDATGCCSTTTVFTPSFSMYLPPLFSRDKPLSFSSSLLCLTFRRERDKSFYRDKEYWWLEEYMYQRNQSTNSSFFILKFHKHITKIKTDFLKKKNQIPHNLVFFSLFLFKIINYY